MARCTTGYASLTTNPSLRDAFAIVALEVVRGAVERQKRGIRRENVCETNNKQWSHVLDAISVSCVAL